MTEINSEKQITNTGKGAPKGNENALKSGFYSNKVGLTKAEAKYIKNFLDIACLNGLPTDLPLLHLAARQLKRLLKAYRFMDKNPENLNPPFSEHLISLENALARNLDRLYMSPLSRRQAGISSIKRPFDLMTNISEGDNGNKG
jgi:hypothetical protein